MSTQLPAGRHVRVTFDIELPVAATPAEVQEWINFAVGYSLMPYGNPLGPYDLVAKTEPVLTDLG